MNFIGTGQRLSDEDIVRAAALIGCESSVIRAVLEVECLFPVRRGFDALNRPTILYEPHIFYRKLPPELRVHAMAVGVAYQRWQEKPYPKTNEGNYTQLQKAILIHQSLALESTSWGVGQVMGFNWKKVGCTSPEDMVEIMKESESRQLDLALRYVVYCRLDDELREHRWAEFAYGYNGPEYARNKYDVKLEKAYLKFKGS